MNAKDFVIPACSLLIVGAGAVTTLTSVAQEQKDIEERVHEVEINQAEQSAQDAQLALTMQRLTKLEEIVQKIADYKAANCRSNLSIILSRSQLKQSQSVQFDAALFRFSMCDCSRIRCCSLRSVSVNGLTGAAGPLCSFNRSCSKANSFASYSVRDND